MPVCGAPLARSPLDPLVTDFRRFGRGPDIPRRLLQSRWIPSTYRRALRSPTTLRAVSRSDGSRRFARCRGSSPLRVAPPSALSRLGRMPVEPLRDREGRPTPSKSTFVIAHERSLYPDPQGLGTLPVAVRRCRGLEPTRDRSVGQGPLCVPSREGRRASPHPKCLSSADTPEGVEGRRASSPAIGAFASVPIARS